MSLRELDVPQVTLDAIMLASSITLFVSEEKVIWFHFIFLLLVITALRLRLVPLVVRAIPVGTSLVIAVFIAWSEDKVPTDELFELPLLGAIVGVVYLTSARRQRLTAEISNQGETIDALHRAARRELQDQLIMGQRLRVTNRLNTAVVHDVNNILAGMLIATEAMEDRAGDAEYIAATSAELGAYTEQAGLILSDLLASARMVNNFTPQPGADVGTALEDMAPLLRRLSGKRCQLLISGTELEATVALPRLRLEQILANLVANAVDAMPPSGGVVSISVAATETTVNLTVGDTGSGIDSEHLDRVFEPYFSTKAEGAGSGLGLYAVHELVADVDGEVSVESTLGEGTLVRICLPIVRESDVKAAGGARAKTRHVGRRHALRILLADDDHFFRETLAESLRAAGHQVTCAGDGDAAYRAFTSSPHMFDAVISDVVMPGRTGVDLARRLAEISPDLPVLLISGHEQVSFDHWVSKHPASVRQKPFSTADLLTDLQVLVGDPNTSTD